MDMSFFYALLLVLIGFVVGRLSTMKFYFGRDYDKLRQADAGAVWERDSSVDLNDCLPDPPN